MHGAADRAVRAYRDAARHAGLLDQQHPGARARGLQRRDGSGESVADDDDIEDFVVGLDRAGDAVHLRSLKRKGLAAPVCHEPGKRAREVEPANGILIGGHGPGKVAVERAAILLSPAIRFPSSKRARAPQRCWRERRFRATKCRQNTEIRGESRCYSVFWRFSLPRLWSWRAVRRRLRTISRARRLPSSARYPAAAGSTG